MWLRQCLPFVNIIFTGLFTRKAVFTIMGFCVFPASDSR